MFLGHGPSLQKKKKKKKKTDFVFAVIKLAGMVCEGCTNFMFQGCHMYAM